MENPLDRGAWRATVHGVTKSWAQPLFTLCLYFHYVHMYSQMILVLFFGSFSSTLTQMVLYEAHDINLLFSLNFLIFVLIRHI